MDKINSIEHALDLAEEEFDKWNSRDLQVLREWQIIFIRNFIIQKITDPKYDQVALVLELAHESCVSWVEKSQREEK